MTEAPDTRRRDGRRHGLVVRGVVAAWLVAVVATTAPEAAALSWLVGLVWVPLVGWLDRRERRGRTPVPAAAWLALDVGLLGGLVLAVPDATLALAVAALPLLGWAVQAGDPRLVAGEGVAILAAVAVGLQGPEPSVHALAEGTLAAVVGVALLGVAGSTRVAVQRRAMSYVTRRGDGVLATTGDAVVVTTPAGVVTGANTALAELDRDVAAGAEVLGRPCEDLLGLAAGFRQLDCVGSCPFADGTDGDVEVWRERDGARQHLLLRTTPVLDHRGEVREVVHALRDVSALHAADEAKQAFLATATHELKTPLAVIVGYGALLEDDRVGPEQRAMAAAAIRRRATELERIVDRILFASRVEAGPLLVAREPTDLLAAIEPTLRDVGGGVRELVAHLPDAVPPVLAERAALVTVVEHLLDNAVKYSPADTPVEVRVEVAEDTVDVAVADQGIGMTAEEAARCFERFWRADDGDARAVGGSGLGLHVVASLADAMDATVAVRSAPGEGTTFTLALRRADRATPPEEDASTGGTCGEASIVDECMRQVGVVRGVV